ncbi:MAG: UDP-3-O-(3-hydroxymyristoyl)glucosamine N-acyltransferase [Gemmatimonadota bacterium]
MKLSQLAARLPDCTLDGNGRDPEITGVAPIDAAGPGEISFIGSAKYLPHLGSTRAGAVIVGKTVACMLPCLRTGNPRLLFARVLGELHPAPRPAPGIHPSAVLGGDVQVGERVSIAAGVVIGNRVELSDDVVIHPHAAVYDDVTIGTGTVIHAGVVLLERTRIGKRCIIYPGAVIGGDGFGHELAPDGSWLKIPQTGGVVIEDDVEIGCLTAIDRPALGVTLIGRGVKIDNMVQVAHGCRIGPHTLLVAQVGLAGGVKTGHHVVLAGQVGVADHVEIGDGAMIGAKSGIPNDVEPGAKLMGYPVVPERQWRRIAIAERRLPELLRTVASLEARVAELEGGKAARRQDGKIGPEKPNDA